MGQQRQPCQRVRGTGRRRGGEGDEGVKRRCKWRRETDAQLRRVKGCGGDKMIPVTAGVVGDALRSAPHPMCASRLPGALNRAATGHTQRASSTHAGGDLPPPRPSAPGGASAHAMRPNWQRVACNPSGWGGACQTPCKNCPRQARERVSSAAADKRVPSHAALAVTVHHRRVEETGANSECVVLQPRIVGGFGLPAVDGPACVSGCLVGPRAALACASRARGRRACHCTC